MTRDQYVHHHAQRVIRGMPRPPKCQVERDLGCGAHTAGECLESMMNIAVNAWTLALSPRLNPEPVPEWSR